MKVFGCVLRRGVLLQCVSGGTDGLRCAGPFALLVGDKSILDRSYEKSSFMQNFVGIPDMKICIVTADVQL